MARDRHFHNGIWRTMAVALAAAMTLSLGFAGMASADDDGGGKHRLFSENLQYDGATPCPAAKDQWLSFNSPSDRDSPLDSNTKAYRLIVPANCYIAAATKASLALNKPVEQVKNLSFDFRTPAGNPPGTVTGGSPRLVAITEFGDAVFMDAANCQGPLAVSGGTWARMDATGFKTSDAPCTIYDSAGVPYMNNATMSAWSVYATANPGDTVLYTFFVTDQAGTYYIDRLSLGTGKLYGNGNSPSQNCPNEGSC